MEQAIPLFVAFDGNQRLALGLLEDVALAVKHAVESHLQARIFVFNADTSELIDFDHRGTPQVMLARLRQQFPNLVAPLVHTASDNASGVPLAPETVKPGRPRLGVVAREVTLLPRHWEWLASQPGGASVALRKLVEQARLSSATGDAIRQAKDAAYRFMSAMGGHLPGFEEAARALFATDQRRFDELIKAWPRDVRAHLLTLTEAAFQAVTSTKESHA